MVAVYWVSVLFFTTVMTAEMVKYSQAVQINGMSVQASCSGVVNDDDYCDCGKDEKLSSACSFVATPKDKFTCLQKLTRTQKFPFSRVGE